MGAIALGTGPAFAGPLGGPQATPGATATARTQSRGGLLYPRQNQHRNALDLSGFWQFQLDPKE